VSEGAPRDVLHGLDGDARHRRDYTIAESAAAVDGAKLRP
jgi:hypothetical protein